MDADVARDGTVNAESGPEQWRRVRKVDDQADVVVETALMDFERVANRSSWVRRCR